MIQCPQCSVANTHVTDSRSVSVEHIGPTVRRRRECRACGYRWTSYEITNHHYEELRDEIMQALTALHEDIGKLIERKRKTEPEPSEVSHGCNG